MPGSFFDTNVLVYLASEDTAKAARAEEILGEGGVISVQVLNEAANVCRRKMRLSWAETRSFLSLLRGLLPVRAITVEIHEAGIALAERYRLSVYDGMVAGAALDADCDVLWSEDMQDGLLIEGRLRVRNPFPVV